MTYCISLGVPEKDFWHMTPHKVYLLVEAEKIRQEKQLDYDNTIAHLQGAYIAEAILATVINFFSEKKNNKFEYPEKPYGIGTNRSKTNIESENDKQLELFKSQLTMTMHNFNLAHKDIEG